MRELVPYANLLIFKRLHGALELSWFILWMGFLRTESICLGFASNVKFKLHIIDHNSSKNQINDIKIILDKSNLNLTMYFKS